MSTELTININQILDLVKPTTSELITIVANDDQIKLALYEKQMTLEKAIEGTTLRKLTKTINDENLTTLIVFLISRLNSNFNVGRKFTDEQAVVMALDLIEVFGYETLEDLLLMFRMVRTGRIGDGKDFKLDSQTVFHKWIPQYLEMKVDLREQLHKKEKQLSFAHEITLEEVKKSYANLSAQKSEDNINDAIDEITKNFTREELEQLISEWEQDDTKKKYLRNLMKKRLTIK